MRMLPLCGFLLILLVWQVIYSSQLLPNALFASPRAAFEELFLLSRTAGFWIDLVATLKLTLIAVIASTCIGIPLGILSGSSLGIQKLIDAPVDFLRSIPAPAIFPIAIMILGVNDSSKLAVAIFACSLLMLVQVGGGVRAVNPIRRRVLETFGASAYQKARLQLIPEIMPHLLTGLRLSVSLALVLIFVAEMLIGSDRGLGSRMMHAQSAYLIEEVYALLICVGLIGYGLNSLFSRAFQFEKRKTVK